MACNCLSCCVLRGVEEHFKTVELDIEQKAALVACFGSLLGSLFDRQVFIALAPQEEEPLDERMVN